MRQIDHSVNIIEVENVSFSYDSHTVLDSVTFNIHKGDYIGIIGPNGGGKSTLLKIMLGLLNPTKGSIKLFGQTIHDFKEWSRIGYVPQHVVRFRDHFPATVLEVVAMGLYGKVGLFKPLSADDYMKVTDALNKVSMADHKDSLITNLSGGQQQRVFIARAIVNDPDVIFLDEPTIGIDVQAQEQFYELLRTLNREHNITMVLATHELDVISQEATECACINQKLVYHGTPEGFLKGKHIEELYGKQAKVIDHH